MLDHRSAVNQCERFAGESAGSESGGDEGDNVERRNRFESMITLAISRARVHDES